MKKLSILLIFFAMVSVFSSNLYSAEKEKKDYKKSLPHVIYQPDSRFVELYYKSWEIAHNNMKHLKGMPQTPFIDEGFGQSNNQNWIWDTCFMVLFCKYAPDQFPGLETLNNFYKPIHDNVMIPEYIHIIDNPPLFAWCEYQNALFTGDSKHIKTLLNKDKYLQRHFNYLENLKTVIPAKRPFQNPTCWIKYPLGYAWEGGRSGMDNTPRGRDSSRKPLTVARPYNPDMLWVDAISQQALSCFYIARLAEMIKEPTIAAEYMKKYEEFSKTINKHYWDKKDNVYYDINRKTLEKIKILTPASYWTVLAKIPTESQVEKMVGHLKDPELLGTPIPWPSLAAREVDFKAKQGDYWRGGVWLPLAYMGIKGLEEYGYLDLAHEQAKKIVDHQCNTYYEYTPHTIWECYSPTKALPGEEAGRVCRPNFCGWSALGPISLLIENVIGIYGVDAFKNEVKWHLKIKDAKVGVENLRFGKVVTDLVSNGDGSIRVKTNKAYTLFINGKKYEVTPSTKVLKLKK